jgi:hypothetical protein
MAEEMKREKMKGTEKMEVRRQVIYVCVRVKSLGPPLALNIRRIGEGRWRQQREILTRCCTLVFHDEKSTRERNLTFRCKLLSWLREIKAFC